MKDDGGTNNVLPVAKALISRGHNIKIFTNGRANERLKESGLKFTPVETTEEVLTVCNSPTLLVTSMCTYGGVGRDLVPILRGVCPTVAVQDYWGCQLTDSWIDKSFRPDFITVNDQFGADLVLKAWPEFNQDHIRQTGFPNSDFYSSVNIAGEELAKKAIREKLKADLNSAVVFFSCGISDGISIMLTEVLEAITNLIKLFRYRAGDLYLVARVHPKLMDIAQKKFKPWRDLLDDFNEFFPGIVVFDESIMRADISILLLASDVVISDYSTILLQAGLIGARVGGKANISIMYPEVAQTQFKREYGGVLDEPPFVTMGCTAKAENRQHLEQLLVSSLASEDLKLKLGENQRKYLLADGRNTQRTVDFLESLLG